MNSHRKALARFHAATKMILALPNGATSTVLSIHRRVCGLDDANCAFGALDIAICEIDMLRLEFIIIYLPVRLISIER